MSPGDNGEITVLVVDDDLLVVRTLCRMIASEGYRVLGTTDPIDACRQMETERVDILLSDVEMPAMNGLDLVALAKRQSPTTVRLLLTGGGDLPGAIRAINEAEVFRFLTKPCEREALCAVLADASDRARQTRDGAASAEHSERRAQLLAALERDHAGITVVERINGQYRIDPARVAAIVQRLPSSALREAWQTE